MSDDSDPRATVDRTRVAAYAVCRDTDGRVLLCHIAPSIGAGDVWTLPGGGLDFGESPSKAVVRELAEETGYRGEVQRVHFGWAGWLDERWRGSAGPPSDSAGGWRSAHLPILGIQQQACCYEPAGNPQGPDRLHTEP